MEKQIRTGAEIMLEKVRRYTGGADAEAEELRLKILRLPDTVRSMKRNFYVSEKGDDRNDGLSPETPIRSFERISDLSLEAGDSVLFERGSTFRSGDEVHLKDGVSYGAYGTGEKPRILGSQRDYADSSVWEKTDDPSVWKTHAGHSRAGVVTFDHDAYCGKWKYRKEELTADGDYYHDSESGSFFLLFSKGNPGAYFDNIEIGTTFIFSAETPRRT